MASAYCFADSCHLEMLAVQKQGFKSLLVFHAILYQVKLQGTLHQPDEYAHLFT